MRVSPPHVPPAVSSCPPESKTATCRRLDRSPQPGPPASAPTPPRPPGTRTPNSALAAPCLRTPSPPAAVSAALPPTPYLRRMPPPPTSSRRLPYLTSTGTSGTRRDRRAQTAPAASTGCEVSAQTPPALAGTGAESLPVSVFGTPPALPSASHHPSPRRRPPSFGPPPPALPPVSPARVPAGRPPPAAFPPPSPEPGWAAPAGPGADTPPPGQIGRSTRLNSSHLVISYAVFCLKKKI